MAPFYSTEIDVDWIGSNKWRLNEEFSYEVDPGEIITVPAGFVTDFASIPRPFWNILPPHGEYAPAALIHDYLYATGGLGGRYTKAQSDDIFREAMKELGVGKVKRNIMWSAVRAFGRGSFQKK